MISRRQWELYGIIYALCRKVSFDLQTLTKYIQVQAWESYLRPFHVQGLRNAHHRERTTQKAHADMYNTRNLPLFSQKEARMYINTHQEDVLVAIRHSGGQSLRSSETRKTNACKRLLYIHGSPTTRRLSAEESVANV
ncbi:hypothetical protein [Bacteroides thetaiotaomicron]|uniref:hypothetical protein n=4 Tax=Bacteroides thetaiotaomicron TaxID=818 RepID=UPI0039C06DB8